MFYTYILYSKSLDRYYIGYSSDIEKRLAQHNSGFHRTKFTRKNANDWELVYKEEFKTKTESIKRENEIKAKKSRIYIEWLLKN